ncbi:1-aminocyclopropane-1-carboxylate oxidase homolog 1-like [Triticum dicoccoides]|uniref:1-aminocyclopropane-1-carboxylate oxidase homolog 1-like n=1 Tax=Triticum dicoccoides TaxID=85692 RepID=UPI001891D7E1|nr:1-aminocyclopropane-1-carboxylate oxidase homolog 1-like [Triticum dicoccoides]
MGWMDKEAEVYTEGWSVERPRLLHSLPHTRLNFAQASTACFDHDRLRALKAFDDTKAGVKGLVDAGVTTIPAIFHHPPESLADAPHLHHGHHQFAIPVIDLAGLATLTGRASVVGAMKAAAQTVGFFQVTNHGVPESAMSEVLAAVRRFNEEPAEAKAPYYSRDPKRRARYQCNFDLFRSPAASWRDTLYMEMAPEPPPPEEIPPACRTIVPEYAGLVQRLGRTLFGLLSEALGLPRRYLEEEAGCLEGLSVGCHYYPACPEPRRTLGNARHSDPSFLTVLLQDAVGGLQVLVDDEKRRPAWLDVPAEAGALVVNVGDYLQILSNDRFRSVEHRVVANGAGPRVSVACFFRADASTRVLAPIVTAGDGDGRARYRSTKVPEMLRHYGAKGLDGVSALQRVRI